MIRQKISNVAFWWFLISLGVGVFFGFQNKVALSHGYQGPLYRWLMLGSGLSALLSFGVCLLFGWREKP